MPEEAWVKVLLRVPRPLHEAIHQLADGDPNRPPASVTATYVWLLRRALAHLPAALSPADAA